MEKNNEYWEKEIEKCKNDYVYFVTNYLYIKKDGEKIPMKISPYHLKLIKEMEKLNRKSLLETIKCDMLIQEIEKHVIKEGNAYLHKTVETVNCFDLLDYLSMDGSVLKNKKPDFYFHLDELDVDIKPNHIRLTVDEYLYKDIKLTLIYS